MNIGNELRYKFLYATPVVRLIIINSVVFLLAKFTDLSYFLVSRINDISLPYIALPARFGDLLMRPWTLLTYQFSHQGFLHIIFNMLVLYTVGGIFMDFFKKRDIWKVYILGGTLAGLFFIFCNAVIPAFSDNNMVLVGASGSVMAILFAAASYAPNIRLNLFGVFQVKLIWIAVAYLVIDLLSIPGANGGGHIAHIGGALFGWLFAAYRKGKMSFSIFEPAVKHRISDKQVKVEVNHSRQFNKVQRSNAAHAAGTPTQEEIDAILDKISKSGYDRLSKEEKDILFKASQD